MTEGPYTVDDFKIGEKVVPKNVKELTLVVVDIDREHEKIICRTIRNAEPLVHKFSPEELEKAAFVIPSHALNS